MHLLHKRQSIRLEYYDYFDCLQIFIKSFERQKNLILLCLSIVFFIRYVVRTSDQRVCFFIEFFEQIRDNEVKISQKLRSSTLSSIQLFREHEVF